MSISLRSCVQFEQRILFKQKNVDEFYKNGVVHILISHRYREKEREI